MSAANRESWTDYLNRPVDAASLGVFRIVFGAMVAIDAYRYLQNGWVDEYFVRPTMHFTYLYFDFVRPLPPPWIYGHFYFIAATAILVALGLFYRVAIVALAVAYTWFFLLEQATYMNHYYLMCLLCWLLALMPAQRAYSLDRWRGATVAATVPQWCVLLLRFQLFVVYFYGAIAKVNPDWLRCEPMYSELVNRGDDVPDIATHFPPALLGCGIAYSGLLIDAVIPIMLVLPPTRWAGFALAFVFHALNAMFLRIGIFSYLMVGAITIFFDPDWPRAVARRFGRPWRPAPMLRQEGRTATPLLVLLHAYVVFQLLFPFRHLLFPGRVSWTEEGHRFAWHMKLRKKVSEIDIIARDPATGRQWRIDPGADLRHRQLRKLGTFPDIMLQYVHATAERLRSEGIADPEIRVEWRCALNGRPPGLLLDPNVDLTKVERTWRHSPWINPYPPEWNELGTENREPGAGP
jgi:vitamin K-dependent gamma-carboxylase